MLRENINLAFYCYCQFIANQNFITAISSQNACWWFTKYERNKYPKYII